jgi:hypothetical protein
VANRLFPPTLTPTARVRIGWSKAFVFECAGRWSCDIINWTTGVERWMWDLQVRRCVPVERRGVFLYCFPTAPRRPLGAGAVCAGCFACARMTAVGPVGFMFARRELRTGWGRRGG